MHGSGEAPFTDANDPCMRRTGPSVGLSVGIGTSFKWVYHAYAEGEVLRSPLV